MRHTPMEHVAIEEGISAAQRRLILSALKLQMSPQRRSLCLTCTQSQRTLYRPDISKVHPKQAHS